jgi:LAO/AO transport system kinase
VARATSDAVIACAAAGYTRVLVETVGVGQSETTVADNVDCLVLVVPPVGGDELQVIKRGITEMADVVVVNKADGPTRAAAARTAAAFRGTIQLHRHRRRSWAPVVLAASAHTGEGVESLARVLEDYRRAVAASGELLEVRRRERGRRSACCLSAATPAAHTQLH